MPRINHSDIRHSNLIRHSSFVIRHSLLALPLPPRRLPRPYFLEGRGTQPALYVIPKDSRVLVFVDAPPAIELPPTYAATLANAIDDHLFKNKATTHLVTQDRLSAMRSDPTFGKLGVADIAKATNADIVIYIDFVVFDTGVSGGAVSQGNAQALVKVIDKDGKRLWPTNQPAGYPVEAHLDEELADQRDQAATQKELSDQLTIHVGRIFHEYSLDDKEMTK